MDTGELLRCPPKDDSYRTIYIPGWLSTLVSEHMSRTAVEACECHGFRYVFRGHGPAATVKRRHAVRVADVAGPAGVSVGTVSAVLNRPASVPEPTRAVVSAAVEELGYTGGALAAPAAAH